MGMQVRGSHPSHGGAGLTFAELSIKGAFVLDLELKEDERGFFATSWSKHEFARRDLDSELSECNVSFNKNKGTLRGMHYQAEPYGQTKLVRCTQGAIYDVIVDLRPDSPTFKKWEGFELTARNRRMLYIPRGLAHGFQAIEDASEVLYQMAQPFNAAAGRGVRWNDPAFGISWPLPVSVISPRDRDYPDFPK